LTFHRRDLDVDASHRQVIDVTDAIAGFVRESGGEGLLNVDLNRTTRGERCA
jgi:thiamine phosphate synthase YjbQ (UPF0047 family)